MYVSVIEVGWGWGSAILLVASKGGGGSMYLHFVQRGWGQAEF